MKITLVWLENIKWKWWWDALERCNSANGKLNSANGKLNIMVGNQCLQLFGKIDECDMPE